MFRLNRKNLIPASIFAILFIALSCLVPAARSPFLTVLKFPLKILTVAKNELGALIFYHKNYAQNERFKKEIHFLRHKLNEREEISLENKRLRDILAFEKRSTYKVIAAEVIGRSPENWSSVIIIDKGKSNGIRAAMTVMTYLGLVGRVVEVGEYSSKAMLINDPNLAVSVLIQRSRQEALISGALGNSLIMKYLPLDADIKISDTVLTSGLTEAYPKGLLVGTVVEIGEEFSGLSRYAIVKPAVNLSNIEEVLVIVP